METTEFGYDDHNRLQWKKVSNAGRPSEDILNYRYDENGNVTQIYTRVESGDFYFTDVSYQWDALNRLTNVVNASPLIHNDPPATSYTYTEVGNQHEVMY